MIDSQSKIIERLHALSLDDSIKQFLYEVMDFYKSHIKKLQAIIMTKQEQIEDFQQTKKIYEDKIEEQQNELAFAKAEKVNVVPAHVEERYRELEMTVESLKSDLMNNLFEKSVYDDDIKNLRNRIEILQNQNDLLLNQTNDLKSELAIARQNSQKTHNSVLGQTNGHYDESHNLLLQEIKNLKSEFNNARNVGNMSHDESNMGNSMTQSRVVTGREAPRRFYNNPNNVNASANEGIKPPGMVQTDQGFYNSKYPREAPVREETRLGGQTRGATPGLEVQATNIEELEGYLKFLLEKEKDLQAKLWRLPSKSRSKVDKTEKKDVNNQLEEVTKEIDSIKAVLKK